ncbi:MAG: efflux RND transporter periplasmic adaptor subunit [Acidobacteriota bacterium]
MRTLLLLLLLTGVVFSVRHALTTDDVEASWTVSRGELVLTVEADGELEAVRRTLIGPPGVPNVWNYKIAWMADEGASVEQGERILSFDTTELQRRLLDAQVRRDRAEAHLEKQLVANKRREAGDALELTEARGKQEKARLKVQVPGQLSSSQALELARIDLKLADDELDYLTRRAAARKRARDATTELLRGEFERAKERVIEIETSVSKMTINAPQAGTVIHVSDQNGQKKKLGDQIWRGGKVLDIPDLTQMRAEVKVQEAQAGQVRVGQRVRLRLESNPDREILGRVDEIRRTVSQAGGSDQGKVVRLRVSLDETDSTMRPGMRLRGVVEVDRDESVLLLPLSALDVRPTGPVAHRLVDGKREPVSLELGRRNADHVEVLGGLAEGDALAAPVESS